MDELENEASESEQRLIREEIGEGLFIEYEPGAFGELDDSEGVCCG